MRRASRIALALSVGLAASVSSAQSVVATGQSFLTSRLLAGYAVETGRMAGLELRLEPGWKTYWRAPGEAGVPPSFDWTGSENLREVKIGWPRPAVFDSFGLQTLGYGGEVVLPLQLVAEDPGLPIRLSLRAEFGVCRDMCLVEEVQVDRRIDPDAAAEGTDQIDAAIREIPLSGAEAGIVAAECALTGRGRERVLDAALVFDRDAPTATVIVEGTEDVWVQTARAWSENDRLRVAADVMLADAATWIDRSRLRMTVLAPEFAADVTGCTAPKE